MLSLKNKRFKKNISFVFTSAAINELQKFQYVVRYEVMVYINMIKNKRNSYSVFIILFFFYNNYKTKNSLIY